MRKYDFISALARETAKEVVRNRDEWMKYLTTAARLYKYPFREQLLIYAQRPDATACASIELWNERMHCWVNKEAKGCTGQAFCNTLFDKYLYVTSFHWC